MIDYLADKFGIQPSKIMIVGDRLDTDVLFGNNNGCAPRGSAVFPPPRGVKQLPPAGKCEGCPQATCWLMRCAVLQLPELPRLLRRDHLGEVHGARQQDRCPLLWQFYC